MKDMILHQKFNINKIYWSFNIIFSIFILYNSFIQGFHFLIHATTIIAVALACDFVFSFKNKSYLNGHSLFLAMVLVYLLPFHMPIYITILSASFMIFIGKYAFSHLGGFFINPSLLAYLFTKISFQDYFLLPTRDSFSNGINFYLSQYNISEAGSMISDFLNRNSLHIFTINIGSVYIDLVLGLSGSRPLPVFLFLIAVSFVFRHQIIKFHITTIYLLTFIPFIWIFEGVFWQKPFFQGDILFILLKDSFLIFPFFLLNDNQTSPISLLGSFFYAFIASILSILALSFNPISIDNIIIIIIFMQMINPMVSLFNLSYKIKQIFISSKNIEEDEEVFI